MHRTPIQVRFADTDALGHVNNAVFATYAETARLAFFRKEAGLYGSAGELAGFILARLAVDFRSQVLLGQEVTVLTRIAELGRTSLTVQQQVMADGVLAAEVESVIVCFDYEKQRPVRIPVELRERAEQLLARAASEEA
ncbi:MAG TPA: thioesterase family protein [Deinococcales bacterium]|nr:thioesterase family protein [Deinococcales bacterium]